MTDRFFADTNIPVNLLDNQGPKRDRAREILAGGPTISTQVLNEFWSVCLKKARLEREEARQLVEGLVSACAVTAVDLVTVRKAMEIGERYRLSPWDSLIIAAALQAGCTGLYSEDLQHRQVFEQQLTVINPFL